MVDSANLQGAFKGDNHAQRDNKGSLLDVSAGINKEFKEKAVKDKASASGGKYGYIDIAATPINPDLYSMVDADILKQSQTIPFFRLGSQLRIAVVNPDSENTKLVIEKLTKAGYSLQINLCSLDGFNVAINPFLAFKAEHVQVDNVLEKKDIEEYQKELENLAKSGEWFDWSTPGMAKFVPIWSNVQRSVSSGVSPGQRKAGTGVAIHVAVRAIPAITGEDQEGNFAFFGGLQATSKSANINMAADGDFIIMDYKDVEELNQGNSEETGNNETERTFDDFGL